MIYETNLTALIDGQRSQARSNPSLYLVLVVSFDLNLLKLLAILVLSDNYDIH